MRFVGIVAIVFGAVVAAVSAQAHFADFSVVSALGDSLTAVAPERGPSYVEHVAAQLGFEFNNYAQEGATTADLLDQGQDADADAAGTTFAFLWIGANDLLFEYQFEVAFGDASFIPDSIANWSAAADALVNSGAVVITANIPDLSAIPGAYSVPSSFYENIRAVTMAWNEALAEAADARGIEVVDVFALYDGLLASALTVCGQPIAPPPAYGRPTDLFYDEIHPSSFGMGLITNAFIAMLNLDYGTSLTPLSEADLAALAGLPCEPDDGMGADDDDGDDDPVVDPGDDPDEPTDDGDAPGDDDGGDDGDADGDDDADDGAGDGDDDDGGNAGAGDEGDAADGDDGVDDAADNDNGPRTSSGGGGSGGGGAPCGLGLVGMLPFMAAGAVTAGGVRRNGRVR